MNMMSPTEPQTICYPVLEKNAKVFSLSVEVGELLVTWQDQHQSRFNRFWLRDNCPSTGNKLSAIRNFHLREMGEHTQIESARLQGQDIVLKWKNENLVSTFSCVWLREHCTQADSRAARKQMPVNWGREINDNIPTIDFAELQQGNTAHLRLLSQVVEYGVSRVVNLPIEADAIEAMEDYLAPFTTNDFGRIFDLISEPDVWDLSQSSEALDPHTDDPYRYAPPGIRILFCLQASGQGGGESQIVNGIAACRKLQENNPKAFELLSSVPIPYIRYREHPVAQGGDVHLRAEAPIICVDRDGEVSGIRFHERSMATFDLPPDLMEDYYLALIEFSKLINNGDFAIEYQLQPGELFVFDNQQVLHGRTAFTGKPGRRHLRLCQMDRDLVHSQYRLLLSSHGQFGAGHVLASGV